jgi:hypothetical protein
VIEPPTVVADQGAGLVKGWAVMGLMHPPEVGHLLRPLALCGERCSRQARAAIAWEYERGSLEIGRSASVIHKRMESYAAAKAAAEEQSRRSDPFSSLWAELRQARAWFDSEGSIPDGASRQAESEAMVALLREGGVPNSSRRCRASPLGWRAIGAITGERRTSIRD